MALDHSLTAMFEEMMTADPIFRPSEFWTDLNIRNQRMLDVEGLENFKRTVSQNYFNWLIADSNHPFHRYVYEAWRRKPNLLPYITRLPEMERLRLTTNDERVTLTKQQKDDYRRYVCYVWTVMKSLDRHRFRKRVGEPRTGNPFPVLLGGKILTQDLANSIIEANVVADLVAGKERPRIAELGAGYGRLGHLLVNATNCQYFVFDIPPTLGVAQWYAEQTLPKERIFRFRRFDRFQEIETKLAESSIAFFTPNQMSMFPDKWFNVILSISTLPELRQEQTDTYLSEFQRLARDHIFLKQWKAWKNPMDGTDLTPESYQFGPEWTISLDRTDPVIPDFFNKVWSRNHD